MGRPMPVPPMRQRSPGGVGVAGITPVRSCVGGTQCREGREEAPIACPPCVPGGGGTGRPPTPTLKVRMDSIGRFQARLQALKPQGKGLGIQCPSVQKGN
ncbi:transcriptional repressor CTCF [Platysternon megacephalum]|uniref:Transcriptional repressor CTCF n=1 Tax=Platysternon megacephalum TaxID=55544 RepID=A0A4D9DPB5_9SAUR|nr:transcriptional repressor CTCF [Platysternon megacephalum]